MEEYKELQGLKYLLYKPKEFNETIKYPMLMYLHGAGERGYGDYQLLKANGPMREIDNGRTLPFIIVYPQCEPNKTWFDYGERLSSLAEMCANLPYADKKRIYLTGNSMGGFGTWSLAMSRPDLFAAIVPVCGGGMPWNTYMLENMPVWAFHSIGDPVVGAYETQKMLDALRKYSKSEIKQTVYPYDYHDAWTETYANPKVYEWLLSKQKGE